MPRVAGRQVPRRVMDPELAALHVLTPNIDIGDISSARRIEREVVLEMRSGAASGEVEVRDTWCPGTGIAPIPVRIYRPHQSAGRVLPALLFVHGGSFVTGGLHTEDTRCERYAAEANCVVVALDYRLAPEHPFPAGFDDCFAVLNWVYAQALELEVDATRIAVGGLSAGGALATGIAARARDEAGPPIVLQMLVFPVLDARADTRSSVQFTDTPVLTADTVTKMWGFYLGAGWPTAAREPPAYASPAHLEDLRTLPPTFIAAAEYDPLRDEALAYAVRLLAQDVSVDLHHYAHTYHSFDGFEAARLTQVARRDQINALRSAFM